MSARAIAAGVALLAGALVVFGCAELIERDVDVEGNLGLGDDALARFNCVACHAASATVGARLPSDGAPSLERVGARRSPQALRRTLLEPHAGDSASAMPDLLAGLARAQRERVADELTHFLESLDGPLEQAQVEVDAPQLERGRQLFHSVGCVACHAAQESVEDLASPIWSFSREGALAPRVADPFGLGAADTSVEALAKYLADPHALRPTGRMPSMNLTDAEARAVAVYLLRERIGAIEERAGWRMEYFELERDQPRFDELVPARTGIVAALDGLPEHREEHFAFRFTGLVDVARTGMAEFAISSDDGSWLYVDGALVIDHGGDHSQSEKTGTRWLEAGRHLVEVRMYENSGQEALEVRWRPAGGEMGSIPARSVTHWRMTLAAPKERAFELDASKVARGRERFSELNCAACHALEGVDAAPAGAPPLAQLADALDRGCLSSSPRAAPRFALDAGTRASLQLALADLTRFGEPLAATDELNATLARLRCANCHTVNNGNGGPDETKRGYFREAVAVDLGNEGRLPPALHRIGAKLHASAVRETLLEGRIERPYLATRMPQFGEANVGRLPELIEAAYGNPSDLVAPPFSAEGAELGRQLAGEKGLGCVQCHLFNGVESLGIPAVDLAHVAKRVKPAWFKQLLLDPKSLNMNSRMPVFWDSNGISAARDILGGDPARQADALWSYVSLGSAMPTPEGLVVPDAEYELVPKDEPILVSVFFEGASPRTMLVGTKELVHYAFDIENSRLVCAWRGRFFNAKGTWHARAGKLEKPPSDDVLWFPKLASVAILSTPDAPWPTALGREAGFRRLGFFPRNEGQPTIAYSLGELHVREAAGSLTPQQEAMSHAGLVRRWIIDSPSERDDVYVLLAEGKRIEPLPNGWWNIEDRFRVSTRASPALREPIVVQAEAGAQLRAPIGFSRNNSGWMSFLVELVAW